MSIETMKLALEALEGVTTNVHLAAIDALRQALEQAERVSKRTVSYACPVCCASMIEQAQPVAFDDWYKNAIWGNEDFKAGCHRAWNAALKHTAPPPRQPLTDEQIEAMWQQYCKRWKTGEKIVINFVDFARAIEAAHGIFANAQNKEEA